VKHTATDWTLRIYMALAFASSLCAVVSLVWAVDKHLYAKELHQQLAEVHTQASQEHQKMAELMAQNRELNSRLAEYQRREAVRQNAAQTGQAQLLEVQPNGVKVMQEPHGGVRYTGR